MTDVDTTPATKYSRGLRSRSKRPLKMKRSFVDSVATNSLSCVPTQRFRERRSWRTSSSPLCRSTSAAVGEVLDS
jgi:hypothetical protein